MLLIPHTLLDIQSLMTQRFNNRKRRKITKCAFECNECSLWAHSKTRTVIGIPVNARPCSHSSWSLDSQSARMSRWNVWQLNAFWKNVWIIQTHSERSKTIENNGKQSVILIGQSQFKQKMESYWLKIWTLENKNTIPPMFSQRTIYFFIFDF